MSVVRIRGRVTGRVQGVSFRWYARQEAERLGLSGWVQNQVDRSVTLEAQGAPDDVGAFVQWLWHGPSHAAVSDVSTEDVPPEEDERGFRIRP